ncbi:peptidase [Providencia rettgeri]|uniref:S8 family serine peptidase n=1 Tax=Providencia rettgeri TaxID=587 RepID=UPI0010115AFE|nr:S8 family serine peptidase [Providencia rettgeri]RXN71302.1 peptidase [Providencia rettgeri]
MSIKIYKYIDFNLSGILVNFNNAEETNVEVGLFLNNNKIDSIITKENHHLFNIDKSGDYHAEVTYETLSESKQKLNSKAITFNINSIQTQVKEYNSPVKTKTINQKVAGVNNYKLDIKVLKGKYTLLETKLLIDLIPINISPVNSTNSQPISQYDYVTYDKETDFESLLQLANLIETFEYVEYCCVTPNTALYTPPQLPFNQNPPENTEQVDNVDDITPNFNHLQTYLDAPKGMNIRNAWNKHVNGSKAVVRHLDFGVYKNHEDLKDSKITVVYSRPETEDCNHGTASTGCIVATNNAFGVTGIAYDCQYYFYDTGDLDILTKHVAPGDIVSLDIQFKINEKLLPATAIRSWWERIKIMVDKGAVVILAAGNGGLDLNLPGVMADYGDSGSMLVGACNHLSGTRAYFSNYNQKTSLINSWGDWSVTTTGYSSLQKLPGNNRNYSKDYSGTSSATPLCSGALALIQDYAKHNEIVLSAWGMREIIKKSTYTEGVDYGIGYRPNVDDLLAEIDKLSQITGAN